MKNANVTATIRNKQNGNPIYVETAVMSTDLPAQQLGELVAEIVHQAWKAGVDPVDTQVVIDFS